MSVGSSIIVWFAGVVWADQNDALFRPGANLGIDEVLVKDPVVRHDRVGLKSGGMLWLRWNAFSGFTRALTLTSRSQFGPYAARTAPAP